MVERLLKDEGWSLKAEVCPVVPPHFLLSSPVPCPFQVSAFRLFRSLLFAFYFLLFSSLLSSFRFENQQFQSLEARESVVKGDEPQASAFGKRGQIRIRPEVR